MLLHAMGLLVLTDDVLPLNEWRDVLFERLPRPDIEAAMSKVEAIAKPAESKTYDQLRRKWRGARKLFFEITNRSEEHTSELQSLMRSSYAVFCLKKKNTHNQHITQHN